MDQSIAVEKAVEAFERWGDVAGAAGVTVDKVDVDIVGALLREAGPGLAQSLADETQIIWVFSGLMLAPASRQPCLVVISDQLIMTWWETGFFRKTLNRIDISKSQVEAVTCRRGARASTARATCLTLQRTGDSPVEIVLGASAPTLGEVVERFIDDWRCDV